MNRRSAFALIGAGALAALAFGPAPALAQDYPTKAINLIVPYAPGGTTDAFGRAFAEYVERVHHAQIVVENRDGAGGTVGTDWVMRQQPDGYTIMYVSSSTALSFAFAQKDLVLGKDLDSLGGINQSQSVWAINPAVIPVTTLTELIDHLKANPGTAYATTGVGSTPHLNMLEFAEKHGLDVEHIPYRGAAGANTALLAGEVGLAIGLDPAQVVASGSLRAVATSGPLRNAVIPDMPTTIEAGYPEFVSIAFGGFAAPAGLPAPIAAKLADWVKGATEDAKFVEQLQRIGTAVTYRTPEVLADDMNANTARYREITEKFKPQ